MKTSSFQSTSLVHYDLTKENWLLTTANASMLMVNVLIWMFNWINFYRKSKKWEAVMKFHNSDALLNLLLGCVPQKNGPRKTGNKTALFWFASNSFWRQQLCSGHEKEKICRNCHLQRWRLHHFRARAHQIYISQVNKSCNFLFLGRYWKVLPFFYSILLLGVFFVMFSWAKYIQNFVFCRLQRPH